MMFTLLVFLYISLSYILLTLFILLIYLFKNVKKMSEFTLIVVSFVMKYLTKV